MNAGAPFIEARLLRAREAARIPVAGLNENRRTFPPVLVSSLLNVLREWSDYCPVRVTFQMLPVPIW